MDEFAIIENIYNNIIYVYYRILSDARSYGETTIHPPTRPLTKPAYNDSSIYNKPLSTILIDEANTMAERDLGSTFLLPHTQLYKHDRVCAY